MKRLALAIAAVRVAVISIWVLLPEPSPRNRSSQFRWRRLASFQAREHRWARSSSWSRTRARSDHEFVVLKTAKPAGNLLKGKEADESGAVGEIDPVPARQADGR